MLKFIVKYCIYTLDSLIILKKMLGWLFERTEHNHHHHHHHRLNVRFSMHGRVGRFAYIKFFHLALSCAHSLFPNPQDFLLIPFHCPFTSRHPIVLLFAFLMPKPPHSTAPDYDCISLVKFYYRYIVFLQAINAAQRQGLDIETSKKCKYNWFLLSCQNHYDTVYYDTCMKNVKIF